MILSWIKWFWNKIKLESPPRYRLRPTSDGRYFVEEYGNIGYLTVDIAADTEEADKIVKSLERDIIYYREK